ncbi:hypothetical protein [Brevibacillus massiliensis]|uniref:globin domain-containing protein n=1 Tax=Brevibacillus massiliensis TaxID=1118054 RepID=UPI000376185B|nr:hypothetical protein [Brevibacillus massiliensis]
MSDHIESQYHLIGGDKTIARLVDVFYDLVAKHPDLAPIFPEDLTETRQNQYWFLTQFLGGPALYSQHRGHPKLRARHMPFPVTPKRAEAWLSCMSKAMDSIGLEGEVRKSIFERLTLTAYHMINTPQNEEKA